MIEVIDNNPGFINLPLESDGDAQQVSSWILTGLGPCVQKTAIIMDNNWQPKAS